MTENWSDFEIECTEYLEKRFHKYAEFIHQGGSNSRVSDILVETKTGKNFFIEVKMPSAQCGQFVLLPNLEDKEFIYSERNENPINEYSKKIIEYMNKNFDTYVASGTRGTEINFENSEKIFESWIKKAYSDKRVKYFITQDKLLINIEDFGENFNISAVYRVKRSGSSRVSMSKESKILNYLSNSQNIFEKIYSEDGKLFVKTEKDIDKVKFMYEDSEYMFSKRQDTYEVRKLSKTHNANVIFSIQLKEEASGNIEEFIKDLM